MKELRGRYGQHQLLNSATGRAMQLLATKILSPLTFNEFLGKHPFILIKPLVGPQEVLVIVCENTIELLTGTNRFRFETKDAAYDYLTQHICTGKYYVIQALPSDPTTLSHFYITLHRESAIANWKVVKSTMAAENSMSGRVKDFVKLWRLKYNLLFAATKLGIAFPNCHTIVIEVAKDNDGNVWFIDTVLHDRNSKWSQYHTLQRKWAMRQFLPATDLCTKKTLSTYLKTYTEVMLKPCVGQQGRGIVKITKAADTSFEVHEIQGITVIDDFDQLFDYLSEHYLSQKDYIVQQRISLAKIKGCPFDVRVIVQLDEDSWIVTGMLVKVAAKGDFVSNRAGMLLTLDGALSATEDRISFDDYAKCIEIITQKASSRLSENSSGLSIIGYDIGIDERGAIWVIEGNYVPALSMFYMFDNNEIHERISYYIKKNKKSNSLKMNGREELR